MQIHCSTAKVQLKMSIVGPTQSWNVTCVVIKKSKTGMEQQKAAQKAMGEVIWAKKFSKTQVKICLLSGTYIPTGSSATAQEAVVA